MQAEQPEKQYTAEENAAAAAKWRELCNQVRVCLDENPNGYSSIWGGDDNISVQMQSQWKGRITMQMVLNWTTNSENYSDFNAAANPPEF